MDIKVNLTTRNYTKGNNKKNDFIVVHYVGAVSSAKANSNYFKSVYRGASAHYFVDENDIYQVVKESDIAWHCGASYYKHISCRNSNSIGIEMCCYNNNGKIDASEKVVERTAELVKELMKKYNIPIENVLRHYDVTGKNCPAPFVENSKRWIEFKEKLQAQTSSKYSAGQFVEVNMPIQIAYDGGERVIVDDENGNQFWCNKSVISYGNRLYARAQICFANGQNYIVQVFNDQFWCKEEYMKEL
jgi:N-acetylmuramoyl-L-alanine amidase